MVFEDHRILAAVMPSQGDLGFEDSPGGEHPGVGLENDIGVVRDPEGGDRPPQFAPRHPPVRNPHRVEILGHGGHIIDARGADRDPSGPQKEGLSGVGFEFTPRAERLGHDPGVKGIGIGVPGDPGRPVRASPVMSEPELLDEDDRLTPLGQVISGGGPNSPRSENDMASVPSFHSENRLSARTRRDGQAEILEKPG